LGLGIISAIGWSWPLLGLLFLVLGFAGHPSADLAGGSDPVSWPNVRITTYSDDPSLLGCNTKILNSS
jgi:hypothetical protein